MVLQIVFRNKFHVKILWTAFSLFSKLFAKIPNTVVLGFNRRSSVSFSWFCKKMTVIFVVIYFALFALVLYRGLFTCDNDKEPLWGGGPYRVLPWMWPFAIIWFHKQFSEIKKWMNLQNGFQESRKNLINCGNTLQYMSVMLQSKPPTSPPLMNQVDGREM